MGKIGFLCDFMGMITKNTKRVLENYMSRIPNRNL
jgi:hypothetical protein